MPSILGLILMAFLTNNPTFRRRVLSPEATVALVPAWKQGFSKQGILKSRLVSHLLNFKNEIKLIYDPVVICYSIINEFNPTFEVPNMGNEAFQMPRFETSHFQTGTRVTIASGLRGFFNLLTI